MKFKWKHNNNKKIPRNKVRRNAMKQKLTETKVKAWDHWIFFAQYRTTNYIKLRAQQYLLHVQCVTQTVNLLNANRFLCGVCETQKMHSAKSATINVCLVIIWLAVSVWAQHPFPKLNATTLNRLEDTSDETLLLSGDYEDGKGLNGLAANRAGSKYQSNRERGKYSLSDLRRNLTWQKITERQGDDPDHRSPIHLIHQKIQESEVSRILLICSFSLASFLWCACAAICIQAESHTKNNQVVHFTISWALEDKLYSSACMFLRGWIITFRRPCTKRCTHHLKYQTYSHTCEIHTKYKNCIWENFTSTLFTESKTVPKNVYST